MTNDFQIQTPSYGIVGYGRAARHFLHYFKTQNIRCKTWALETHKNSVEEELRPCDVILLLISDSAIADFIDDHDFLLQKEVVHFSGSLVIDGVQSMHPLMTFGDDLYPPDFYKRIPFVYEKGKITFDEVFPELENPSFAIEAKDKPLYHSLCVLAGNFTTLLWQKFFSTMNNKFGLQTEHLTPYLDKITENIKIDADKALTGPLSRKDIVTIQKNLEALQNDPFHEVYKSFVSAYNPELLKAPKELQ